jgi:tRNA(Ile)-lysidine synthase
VARVPSIARIRFDRKNLRVGTRVAVAVSGGADSVGLLRALHREAAELGLVLAVAHVHHGIRGAEADEDERFVGDLADDLGLELWAHRVETPAVARERKQTLEEAARELRYAWFRELLAQGKFDAVATAHTLDDQAETVLHRLLRGAWTEGLGGIHPVVHCARGSILRPFLETRREEIREWLQQRGQPWREDATNQDTAHTRNRIRLDLMPRLGEYNPQVAEQLARLATIARDEESWWDAELARILPGLVLPGKPVRGGGRAVSTHPEEGSAGIELERLRALAPAVRRRVLRAAAKRLGCALNFEQTERLMAMCEPEAAKKQELAAGLWAEKSARELRLVRKGASREEAIATEPVEVSIPGEASGFGVRLRMVLAENASTASPGTVVLRTPRAGDRVRIRHSRGAKPLKEIFERMQVEPEARKTWPVLEWQRQIVWMKGVELEPEREVPFAVEMVSAA